LAPAVLEKIGRRFVEQFFELVIFGSDNKYFANKQRSFSSNLRNILRQLLNYKTEETKAAIHERIRSILEQHVLELFTRIFRHLLLLYDELLRHVSVEDISFSNEH